MLRMAVLCIAAKLWLRRAQEADGTKLCNLVAASCVEDTVILKTSTPCGYAGEVLASHE